jgi:hypothetical protein
MWMRFRLLALLIFTALGAAGCGGYFQSLKCAAPYFPNPACSPTQVVPPAPAQTQNPLSASFTASFVSGSQIPPITFTAIGQSATITVSGPAANPTLGQPFTFSVVGNPCVTLSQAQDASVVVTGASSGTCFILATGNRSTTAISAIANVP